ncbi:hypothetical protein ACQY0O_004261 [Thecaphora frezii]
MGAIGEQDRSHCREEMVVMEQEQQATVPCYIGAPTHDPHLEPPTPPSQCTQPMACARWRAQGFTLQQLHTRTELAEMGWPWTFLTAYKADARFFVPRPLSPTIPCATEATAMFGLIKSLLLVSLAVQTAYAGASYQTWHLVAGNKELRQCTNVTPDVRLAMDRNHVCTRIVASGPNDIACRVGSRIGFSSMNRFVVACKQANGKVVDAPTGKAWVYLVKDGLDVYDCTSASADLVYASFSLNRNLCYGPSQTKDPRWSLVCSFQDGNGQYNDFKTACGTAFGTFVVSQDPGPGSGDRGSNND